MGNKRKRKEKEDSHIRRKIKRLKNQLRRYSSSDDERSSDRSSSSPPVSEDFPMNLTESEDSQDERLRSVVRVADPAAPAGVAPTGCDPTNMPADSGTVANSCPPPPPAVLSVDTVVAGATASSFSAPTPSTSATASGAPASLPAQILEALGDPKIRDEVFGPKIQEAISERWGRVLVDGLTKEQKQALQDKMLIPENFKLAKAPALNPEIAHVLSDPVKSRDKLLERSQNLLGLGISGLSNLTSSLIDGDVEKIEIIRRLSEVSQVFLELHYDNTKTRRKLIVSSLDKKFTGMIADVKRDAFLFGANLAEKIKASKTVERSGLQIRRQDSNTPSKKPAHQPGNWRGPPRQQGPNKPRQGGPKNRYWSHASKRPPPAADRAPATSKASAKPRKTQ